MAFERFIPPAGAIGNKPSRHARRRFALPPYDTDWLMQLHPNKSTYQCDYCKDARRQGRHKTGYGRWLHQELERYRKP